MQFIISGINIDFVGKMKLAFSVSGAMILISILSIIFHGGLRYGVDFAGGTVIQVKFFSPVSTEDVKSAIAGLGDLGLGGNASVQRFGEKNENEYLIHTDKAETTDEKFSEELETKLKNAVKADVEIRRIEIVGPQVGKDLREKALFAIFYSLLLIAIYISGRFESQWIKSGIMAGVLIFCVYTVSNFGFSIPILILTALMITLVLFWFLQLKYAMGAIVALIHDVTITIGLFSLFDKEVSLPIIAAILTIIGYSLNDTIIVYDRIRENLKKYQKLSLKEMINRSVNETLSRTILTSGTTLITVVALLILGGGIIHDFAFAMTAGIVVGTYSSVYVASPILILWQERDRRK